MDYKGIRDGQKVAKKGIIILFIMAVIKLTVGYITGLEVVVAYGINTFADMIGIFAAYIGLKLSFKNADAHFRYGYYKIETVISLLISLGIIYLGGRIFLESFSVLDTENTGQFFGIAVAATLTGMWHAWRLSRELVEAGIKANSLSLIASGKDKGKDALAGFAILASIFANYFQIPYVEGAVSFVISLMILKEGLTTFKESLLYLLDYWNDPKMIKKIKKIFRKEKDLILKVRKVKLRRAGTFILGEAFVEINPFAGIQDLRAELDFLSKEIKEVDPYLKDFSIYTHIPKLRNLKIAVPVKKGEDMDAELAGTLEETRGYVFVEIKNGVMDSFYFQEFLAGDSPEKNKTLQLIYLLKEEKVNVLINNKLNSLLYYNLRRTHNILVYPNFSDVRTVEGTIKLLLIDI